MSNNAIAWIYTTIFCLSRWFVDHRHNNPVKKVLMIMRYWLHDNIAAIITSRLRFLLNWCLIMPKGDTDKYWKTCTANLLSWNLSGFHSLKCITVGFCYCLLYAIMLATCQNSNKTAFTVDVPLWSLKIGSAWTLTRLASGHPCRIYSIVFMHLQQIWRSPHDGLWWTYSVSMLFNQQMFHCKAAETFVSVLTREKDCMETSPYYEDSQ